MQLTVVARVQKKRDNVYHNFNQNIYCHYSGLVRTYIFVHNVFNGMAAQLLPFVTKKEFQCFVYGFCCCLVIIVSIISFFNNKFDDASALISTSTKVSPQQDVVLMTTKTDEIKIPMDPFPEPAWRTQQTLATRTLTSTSFARFEIHQVLTDSGTIVDDWLWTDERSHVNILVHLKDENKYLLFHQKKYGLEKPMYAAIGGLFEKGEQVECF